MAEPEIEAHELQASKKKGVGARFRLIVLLIVIAAIGGVAVFGTNMFAAKQEARQADERGDLLRLLADGALTPEQAAQLGEILEPGALGAPDAALDEPASAPGEAAPEAETEAAAQARAADAAFDASARQTYREAFVALSVHPEPNVRLAAAQLSQEGTRDTALQSLFAYAGANPDDPLRGEIYRLCGAVGERNDNAVGQQALLVATNLSSGDGNVWRMLARAYRRAEQTRDADAAMVMASAADAREAGDAAAAEQHLRQAFSGFTDPGLRASAISQLGDIAAQRGDWTSASAQFSEAYRLREQSAAAGEDAPARMSLEADAQNLVNALDRSGRTREACARLQEAQGEYQVAAPSQDLLTRCQTQFRAQLSSDVGLAPQLRSEAVAAP